MQIIEQEKNIFFGDIVPYKDGDAVVFKCSSCGNTASSTFVEEYQEYQISCVCFPGKSYSCNQSVIDAMK